MLSSSIYENVLLRESLSVGNNEASSIERKHNSTPINCYIIFTFFEQLTDELKSLSSVV